MRMGGGDSGSRVAVSTTTIRNSWEQQNWAIALYMSYTFHRVRRV